MGNQRLPPPNSRSTCSVFPRAPFPACCSLHSPAPSSLSPGSSERGRVQATGRIRTPSTPAAIPASCPENQGGQAWPPLKLCVLSDFAGWRTLLSWTVGTGPPLPRASPCPRARQLEPVSPRGMASLGERGDVHCAECHGHTLRPEPSPKADDVPRNSPRAATWRWAASRVRGKAASSLPRSCSCWVESGMGWSADCLSWKKMPSLTRCVRSLQSFHQTRKTDPAKRSSERPFRAVLEERSSSQRNQHAAPGPGRVLVPSRVGGDVPCASRQSPELAASISPPAERGNALGTVSV